MKKLLLIINPHAGQMRLRNAMLEVLGQFNDAGFAPTVLLTRGVGDAERFALMQGDWDRIVCAGGDGTLSEVVGANRKREVPLPIGYLPVGSTNDFAAGLGLSTDIKEAVSIAAGDHLRTVDVGSFGERTFSYVASFGAFARTSFATPQGLKNTLGHLAYLLEGVRDFASIRPTRVRVTDRETGTEHEEEVIFGAVANALSVGGVLTLNAEQVSLDDGKFEVLLIKNPQSPSELAGILRALHGQDYESCAAIDFFKTGSLAVRTAEEMEWSVDGERACPGGTVSIVNLPRQLRVFTREK